MVISHMSFYDENSEREKNKTYYKDYKDGKHHEIYEPRS